nr:uncharacterized protein LOC113705890 [Coffea arabica]
MRRFWEFLREERWDYPALASLLAVIGDAAQGSFFCFGSDPDTLIWLGDPSGVFSTRSAYQLVRPARACSWAFSFFWQSSILRKLSFFMWRLVNGQLLMDNMLEKFQVYGPSKCHCCVPAQLETMEHVFSTGQLATKTWAFFEYSLGISASAATVRSRCAPWWLFLLKGKALCWLMRILPILILWFLWWVRNMSRFEGRKIAGSQIRALIVHEVRMLIRAHFSGIMVPCQWEELLEALTVVQRALTATAVRWIFPPAGYFKLNTDGCATDRGSGGCGVIRDSCGRLIVAFADSFGCVDSLQAEARALLLGLQLGRQVGVSRLIVESNCLVLINCLRREWGVSAGIRPIVRAIRLDEPSSH